MDKSVISTDEQWKEWCKVNKYVLRLPFGSIEGRITNVFFFATSPDKSVCTLKLGETNLELNLCGTDVAVITDTANEAAILPNDYILLRNVNFKPHQNRIWSTSVKGKPPTEFTIRRGTRLIEIQGKKEPVISDIDISKVKSGEDVMPGKVVPGMAELRKELTQERQESDFTWASNLAVSPAIKANSVSRMLLKVLEEPCKFTDGLVATCTDYSKFETGQSEVEPEKKTKLSVYFYNRAQEPFNKGRIGMGDIIDVNVVPGIVNQKVVGKVSGPPERGSSKMIEIFEKHKLFLQKGSSAMVPAESKLNGSNSTESMARPAANAARYAPAATPAVASDTSKSESIQPVKRDREEDKEDAESAARRKRREEIGYKIITKMNPFAR